MFYSFIRAHDIMPPIQNEIRAKCLIPFYNSINQNICLRVYLGTYMHVHAKYIVVVARLDLLDFQNGPSQILMKLNLFGCLR